MTRQKKTRREAGRTPSTEMTTLEKERSHPSLSKLKPKQRSVYANSLQNEEPQAKSAKRKSRLKTDPAVVAQNSRELMAQSSDAPPKPDSSK